MNDIVFAWRHALTHSDSISDVARLCGFREPLYFSRLFKKKYGVSPSYYAAEVSRSEHASEADNVKIYLS